MDPLSAYKELQGSIKETTIIQSKRLDDFLLDLIPERFDRAKTTIFKSALIAYEGFQHTASFKYRAAYNAARKSQADHLIAASSGNFGQALAYAAKIRGKKCTIVMPETSAQVKIQAVRNHGAQVVLIDTDRVSRADALASLCQKISTDHDNKPAVFSPYDHADIIEGNSTLGIEIASLVPTPDLVIAPVGGGGLLSGICLGLESAIKQAMSNNLDLAIRVIGAEPQLANDAARSLAAGHLIANEKEPRTIADGARTISLGKLNFEILQARSIEILEITEEQIAEATFLLFDLCNLKCEPTGALSLAALIQMLRNGKDLYTRPCLVVSGANVDSNVYARLINQPTVSE